MGWMIDNGDLTNNEFVDLELFSTPGPYVLWQVDNGDLKTHQDIVYFTEPLPNQVWKVNNNELNDIDLTIGSTELDLMGAFCHSKNLRNINMNSDVKSLGDVTFLHSGLTRISIPQNCSFGKHTFPKDCEVTYMDSE